MRISNLKDALQLDINEIAQVRYQNAYVKRITKTDFEFISYRTTMFIVSLTPKDTIFTKINESPSVTTSKQISTFIKRSFDWRDAVDILSEYKKLSPLDTITITALMSL